jgi:hypothetical protein
MPDNPIRRLVISAVDNGGNEMSLDDIMVQLPADHRAHKDLSGMCTQICSHLEYNEYGNQTCMYRERFRRIERVCNEG